MGKERDRARMCAAGRICALMRTNVRSCVSANANIHGKDITISIVERPDFVFIDADPKSCNDFAATSPGFDIVDARTDVGNGKAIAWIEYSAGTQLVWTP